MSQKKIDFIDQNGDAWTEYPILHPKFKEWILKKKNWNPNEPEYINNLSKEDLQKLFQESPWYKSTANDIDWVKRVEIQGIIQKYITHSISSTINLPNSVTEAEVSEIYMESWKKGLKGITVYRDGSRSGVLITESTKDKQDTFEYRDAPKRPKELPCDIHHLKIKDEKFTVLIGMLDNKPYEVFVIPYEIGKNYKTGFLNKQKSGKYNLTVSIDEELPLIFDVAEKMTDTEETLTRLISTSLRHGSNIQFIVEQLNKSKGDMFSFSKSIARVLKKYIPDGTKSTVKCNECGSSNVIFQEGCMGCKDCGSSKCG